MLTQGETMTKKAVLKTDSFLSPDSSNIAGATYNETKMELLVMFKKGGRRYLYANFPPEMWQRFKAAPSKGEFVNHTIIPAFKGVAQ